MRVTVIGSGVIGLSCALRLAEAGHRVTVAADRPVGQTISWVAGGIFYPRGDAGTLGWTAAGNAEFRRLATIPGTGVRMMPGRMLRGTDRPLPSWADAVGGMDRRTDPGGGFVDALEFTTPMIDTSVYLDWLIETCRTAGVRFERRTVADLGQVDGDLAVNAAGAGAAVLAGDDTLRPVRGQVVHIADPGLREWVVDEDAFDYVLPHGTHAVCGGTEEFGRDDPTPDEATTAGILRRCTRLVPEVADATVLRVLVGARPVRDRVRLERDGRVIHCYGHGGSGVTLSWGCADAVRALAE